MRQRLQQKTKKENPSNSKRMDNIFFFRFLLAEKNTYLRVKIGIFILNTSRESYVNGSEYSRMTGVLKSRSDIR